MKYTTRSALTGALFLALTVALPATTASASADPRTDWPLTGVQCGWDSRTTPPVISLGSTGRTVREAKCLLEFWGFPVSSASESESESADEFGGSTFNAVRGFQTSRGLDPDGTVGAATWAQLRSGPF